jgi:hypothetical protein
MFAHHHPSSQRLVLNVNPLNIYEKPPFLTYISPIEKSKIKKPPGICNDILGGSGTFSQRAPEYRVISLHVADRVYGRNTISTISFCQGKNVRPISVSEAQAKPFV